MTSLNRKKKVCLYTPVLPSVPEMEGIYAGRGGAGEGLRF